MKNHSTKISLDKAVTNLAAKLITIIIISFLFVLTNNVFAQVTFTQTSDDDFNLGFHDNVLVSGGSVYLAGKATGVNNWISTNDLPETLIDHKVTRWKNYVYLAGGFNGAEYSNSVYRATMLSGGNSTWTALDTLPEPLRDHAIVTALNYMYVIGGRTDGAPSDKIYYAAINSDGSLGEWMLSSVTLPQPLWGHTAAFHNGFLYVVGGTNLDTENSALNTVYYSKKTGPYGDLSAFTATSALPDARNGHSMVCYNGKLIALGGYDNGGTKQNTVYYTDLNLDGTCSSWLSSTALTEAVSNHSSTCYNGLITIIGGETTSTLSDKIYYADIDNLPALTWNLAVDLLYEARKDGAAYTYNGQIVFAGGENLSGSIIHNTRYATVNLGSDKVHKGRFISYPFFQLGEERDIESLTYNITYNVTYNNYELLYRVAGSDQLWGDWTEMGQDNPALVGQHKQYVQYMIKFDGTDDDNVTFHDLTVNISGYTELSGSLNAMDTLKYADSPFWATANISFTAGTHYIEPGVTILFSPNTGLEIGQANFNCGGTVTDSILFTSFTSEVGTWNGIYFNASSDISVASELSYVIVEKAGNGTMNANLYCYNTNEPHILNSTLREADGNGIRLNNADLSIGDSEFSDNIENGFYIENSFPSLTNVDILSNDIAGIYLADATSNPNFFNCQLVNNNYGIYYPSPNTSTFTFAGISNYNNLISGIAIGGGDVTADQTWSYNPEGYAILGNIKIVKQNTNPRLTIAPGNTIMFDSLVQLQVGNYIYYNQNYGGELFAIGKPDSMITFTSLNSEPGGWEGIYFHYNSDNFSSVSELNNCIIQNGNAYNIRCEGTLQPRIDSCTINNSNVHDIYIQDPNSVPHITATTSTVYLEGGTQSIDKIWYNFGGEYIILNDIIIAKQNSKATLTVQPGITIKSDTSAMLQIGNYIYYNQQYGGELFAEGSSDSIITFTSRNGLIDGWDGIYFHYNSDNFGSTSSLKYCTIEKGKNFNIKSTDSDQPRIDNCTINNTDGYDIYAETPNSVQHVTNTISTVYVNGGTQSINKKWYYFGGDYVAIEDIYVAKQNDTAQLTIEPGIQIKFDTSAMLQIGHYIHYNQNYGGELNAEGKADSLITFTSLNGLVGGWDGIYFHYNSDAFGSTSILDYCVIDKGDEYNIKCYNTLEPRIDNCTITNSNGYDIYAENPNSVPHVTNTNSTVYVGVGTQSIDMTWYNFGGDYVVVGDVIIAKQNSHSRLTIEPGNIIKFDTAVKLQIGNYISYNQHYGGELYAEGTYDSLITFKPWNNSPGGWDGIYFHYNSDNFSSTSSLKYCSIEEAATNNIYCDGTNEPAFDHVTIFNSMNNGIRLNNSSPYLRVCQIINNDTMGIYLTGSSNPVIGDTLGFGCDIYGNGMWDVYNETSNHIYARNNFWNSTDSITIASGIYDYYDNTSQGIVEFMPFATTSFFDNHPPDDFALLTLPDNTVTSNKNPDFTWEESVDPNGDAISYYFYYTDDNTWSTNIVISAELTSASYTIPETLTGGKWYWWRVKATDGYLSKYSNEIWTFAVSLPPTIPVPIVPPNGTKMREDDFLVWLTSTDPDAGDYVSHYHLQIDDDSDFSSPVIDTSGITDNLKSSSISMQLSELPNYMSLENKIYYWRVSAVDGFGVESNFSDGTNYFLYQLDVNLKVYIEGPFISSVMNTTLNTEGLLPLSQPYNIPPWNYPEYESVPAIPNIDVVDWILIELRETTGDASTATKSTVIFTKAAFLLDDGSIVDLDGISPLEMPVSFDDNIFVVIYHRNHLNIMTSVPLSPDSGTYNYDFSTDASQVFGGSAGYKDLGAGIWGMVSGNADANEVIDMDDKNNGWSTEAGNSGYTQGDFNMDGEVDNPDKNESWLNNIGKNSEVPE